MIKYLFTTKRCFSCNKTKPLFLFNINTTKHSIASDKGRCVNCRKCSTINFIKNKGYVVAYIDKKFQLKQYEYNLISIIKYYLK